MTQRQRQPSRRADPKVPGGWGIPDGDFTKQRHYFLALDGRSLCGLYDPNGVTVLMPEIEVRGEDDHETCRQRLAELTAAMVSERGTS